MSAKKAARAKPRAAECAPPFVQIDSHLVEGKVIYVALDANGRAWVRRQYGNDTFPSWARVDGNVWNGR